MTKIIKNQPLIIQKKNGNLVVKRNLQAFRALRGILKGKKATSFPGEAELIRNKGGIHTGKGLERDGNIITANGSHSAKIFGEAILEINYL